MSVTTQFTYEEVTGFRFPTSIAGVARMSSHVYYVDGLLIDTGHPRKRKQVLAATADLPVEQIFVTHHHEDHTGNVSALGVQFGVMAFASELCCEIMKDPPPLSLAQRLVWGDRPAIKDLIPLSGRLETKRFKFDIIPIPGHADDMVALYEPQRKWLFSADLFVSTHIGYFLKNESMAVQIQSIKKILELNFDVMFCSHNPKLENAREKLKGKLDNFETFFESVSKLHEKGYSVREIFREMDLKEQRLTKLLSGGQLSKVNMIESVIRDIG